MATGTMRAASGFRVDFLIGGTQKGGTSALAHFLSLHPEIFLPNGKEAHFFDRSAYPAGSTREYVARRYREKFPTELRGRLVGDATPIYMYLPFVPERVQQHNPAMKWVLLLREPVARAVSHYSMSRAKGQERLSPTLAFRAEPFRLWRARRQPLTGRSSLRHHSYLDRGFYSAQIARIREFFPAEQVLILTTERLRHRHEETLREVYAFLGIEDRTILPPAAEIFATSKKVLVSGRTRAWLREQFAPEVMRIEAMLGRPLDEWRQPEV